MSTLTIYYDGLPYEIGQEEARAMRRDIINATIHANFRGKKGLTLIDISLITRVLERAHYGRELTYQLPKRG